MKLYTTSLDWCLANTPIIGKASHWACINWWPDLTRLYLEVGKNGRNGREVARIDVSLYTKPHIDHLVRVREKGGNDLPTFLLLTLLNDPTNRSALLTWLHTKERP